MNKKLNLTLNVIETVFLILLVSISTFIYMNQYSTNQLGRVLITSGMMILEVGIVSIELFMFYLQNKNTKILSLVYYLVIMMLILTSQKLVPFYGIILVIGLNISKNVLRVQKIDMIFDRDILYDLCDLFHIKIKKVSKNKARVIKKTTKKATTKTKKATATKPKTTRAKATTTKKTSKSYA